MDVQISNNLDPLTKENMMDMPFETTVMSADGTTATGTCKLSDIASWTTGTAVSYTHLDVYKRQPSCFTTRSAAVWRRWCSHWQLSLIHI